MRSCMLVLSERVLSEVRTRPENLKLHDLYFSLMEYKILTETLLKSPNSNI